MATVTKPNTFAAGATIIASEHNDNFDTIYNDYNGNITNVNIANGAAIANSKLNLTTITQDVAFSSAELLFTKGADVASGTSITLGTDGNHFDITGTTTIQTITAKQAGSVVWLKFDGALTLTDDTGNLELQGADVSVSAEDTVCLVCDGTNWHLVSNTGAATNLEIPSEAQGDVLYRNATVWTRLGAGTAGQILTTQGAAANPTWGNQDLELISTTTISSGTNSGNITIAANKQYVIRFFILNDANAANQIDLAFNDSNADVAYWKENRLMNSTPTVTTTGSVVASVDVPLGSLDELNGSTTSGQMWGEIRLDTTPNTNNTPGDIRGMFTVEGVYQNDDVSFNGIFIHGLVVHNGTALTSFEFVSSSTQNFTGSVYVYEYALS